MYDTVQRRFPNYGIAGVVMVLIFWAINWHLPGLRSHWAFFPLWLGYILLVNGLTHLRKGTSLLSRDWKAWIFLFIVSAPVWWIFEWLNKVAHYWVYLGVESFSDFQYNLQASISFSTVIPAIFGTTELINTFRISERVGKGPRIGRRKSTQIIFFITGWLMLVILLIWPAYGAAFMWMSLFFILDPVNNWLGYPSILKKYRHRKLEDRIQSLDGEFDLWIFMGIMEFLFFSQVDL
ncbi:MAG: hypothetical protein IPL46_19390 [Saprospiraceae bacterium]|nr:hypothetical protein [Saprospiraceae bacterium]